MLPALPPHFHHKQRKTYGKFLTCLWNHQFVMCVIISQVWIYQETNSKINEQNISVSKLPFANLGCCLQWVNNDQMEDKKILFFEASNINANLKIFEPWHKFAEQDIVLRKPKHRFDNIYTFFCNFSVP